MNFLEFPVGPCGCCWHLPGHPVKVGGKTLLQVGGGQGNSTRT